jgi:ABC-2 type transport system permease protein
VTAPIANSGGRGDAEIAARGFQRYDGPRSGVSGAVRSVMWQSIRATLGLGRPARHKIFPIASVGIAYIPAIAFVGLAVLLPENVLDPNEIATYSDYYGVIVLAIVLFAALVAPEALVTDRRNGMLAMYLSTPLSRGTYIAAKVLAVGFTLALVTLGPPLLMLIGYTVDGSGPDGVGNWLLTLIRLLVSALAVSAAITAVSLGISSITDRRAFASIGFVLVFFVSSGLAGALVEGAGMSTNWWLIDLSTDSFELVTRIYGDPGAVPELGVLPLVGANVAWTALGAGIVWWRYSRLVIAR